MREKNVKYTFEKSLEGNLQNDSGSCWGSGVRGDFPSLHLQFLNFWWGSDISYKAREKHLYSAVRTHNGSAALSFGAEWRFTWRGAQGSFSQDVWLPSPTASNHGSLGCTEGTHMERTDIELVGDGSGSS